VSAIFDTVRFCSYLPKLIGAAAIIAMLAPPAAMAQQTLGGTIAPTFSGSRAAISPGLPLHAVNPSLSLTAPATSPIQAQIQDDYATSLTGAQRQLFEQNPSGTTHQELLIGRQLNDFAPR
jgi:hypothetical protein